MIKVCRGRTVLASLAAVGVMISAASAEEVVVGVELPLTGPVATWAGVPPRGAIELAIDEVNKSGELGPHKIKMILQDMASDKNQAISLTNQFIKKDNVSLIIGPSTTPFAAAAAPIANEEKTPMITLAASDSITKTGPYIFKMITSAGPDMDDLSNFVITKIKPKNYVTIYNRDNDAYVEYARLMRGHLEKAGIKSLGEESTLASETDFTALASKLVQLNPDAIFIAMVAEQAANIIIQARQAGLSEKVKLFGLGGGIYPQYARIGGKAVEGTYYISHHHIGTPGQLNKTFVESYRAKFNRDPDEYTAFAYGAVKVAAKAIVDAGGGNREKIRNALANIKDVPTVLGTGKFTFDQGRAPLYGSVMLQIKNGASVLAE
jgi:branched-chain amino acid transport system substrate-binding protein